MLIYEYSSGVVKVVEKFSGIGCPMKSNCFLIVINNEVGDGLSNLVNRMGNAVSDAAVCAFANQRSIGLSQELLVGMKCAWKHV